MLSMRRLIYRSTLKLLKLDKTFSGKKREYLGVSPYPRRSPMILTFLNIQELIRFFKSPKLDPITRKSIILARKSKAGKKCLLLGNGPSLRNLEYSSVADDNPDIWVMNDFYKTELSNLVKVSFYVLSDSAHLDEENFLQNPRLFPILEKVRKDSATLVVPHSFQNHIPETNWNISTIFFDDRELSAWTRNIAPYLPRGYIGLTAYKALAYCIHFGYDEIFILGMDSSEFQLLSSDKQNRILLDGNHAYNDDFSGRDYSEHFLDGFAGAFMTYAHTSGDIERFEGPIFNLDSSSFITKFPKISKHNWLI